MDLFVSRFISSIFLLTTKSSLIRPAWPGGGMKKDRHDARLRRSHDTKEETVCSGEVTTPKKKQSVRLLVNDRKFSVGNRVFFLTPNQSAVNNS